VVGATGSFSSYLGSAHIFDLNGVELAKISRPSDASFDSGFGKSVAVGLDRIVVGASYSTSSDDIPGTAYIFDLNGNQLKKITASDSDGSRNDFGGSVAIGSNRIVVSARSVRSVYVFDLDGNELNKINIPGSGGITDASVDVGSDRIVFGATDGTTAGSAYIFDLNGNQLKELDSGGPASNYDDFGKSVAIGSDRIFVGSPWIDDSQVNNIGAVFIYDLDGNPDEIILTPNGNPVTKIVASDSSRDDLFGTSVDVSENNIVVGTPFVDDNGTNSGAVYIYS
jgi:hypothetical protein